MEMGCIGFLLGAVACLVFVGLGVCIGDRSGKGRDNGQSIPDSDVRIYVYNRDRNRGGNKNNNPPTFEEKMMVLNTLRVGISGFEQKVIDCIQEDMINERNKMDSRREEASQN